MTRTHLIWIVVAAAAAALVYGGYWLTSPRPGCLVVKGQKGVGGGGDGGDATVCGSGIAIPGRGGAGTAVVGPFRVGPGWVELVYEGEGGAAGQRGRAGELSGPAR